MNRPTVIQGGMGVAVSSWQLARAVSRRGQLGVVSGTALDAVIARKLQDGDPGGHVQRALAAFPNREMAQRVLDRYYLPKGRGAGVPYRPHPTLTIEPGPDSIDLSLTGNFVEVWLAKEGHDGLVGINLLEKLQVATPSALLGAMLADVDYVIMGAGMPTQIPRLLTDYASHQPGRLTINVLNATREHVATIDPVALLGDSLPPLRRPQFLAIVSAHVLASYLHRNPETRPDGFVVEGFRAGGHSAPPRGKMVLDETGSPIYGPQDIPDLTKIQALGLPFWLAGGYDSPEQVAVARDLGAHGVQVGTLFAMSEESGLRTSLRTQLLERLGADELVVRNDPLASPTGFPFKIAELPGTLSEPEKYAARNRICDLAYLRTPVERDGVVRYRCPSEPAHMYLSKGGDESDLAGRMCLCNALMANIGLAQLRRDGYVEEPAVTLGQDLDGSSRLLQRYPGGWTASQAIDWLLS